MTMSNHVAGQPFQRDYRNWQRVLAIQKPLSKLKPKSPITRTWFALCNPGQRRAIQVLIVNTGVNIGRR